MNNNFEHHNTNPAPESKDNERSQAVDPDSPHLDQQEPEPSAPRRFDPEDLDNFDPSMLDPDELAEIKLWLPRLEPHHHADAIALMATFGEAFDGYVDQIYPKVHQHLDGRLSLKEDFVDHYIGSYTDLEDWAKEYVENQGWHFIIKETLRREGIPEDLVQFNYEPFIAMVHNPANFEILWGDKKAHIFYT